MKKIFLGLLISLLLITGCSSQESQSDLKTFKLGFIPTEKAETLTPKAEAMAEFLETQMGIPVEVVIPTHYESLIEGLRFNNLDAAFMDSSPAWIAVQKANAEVVLAEVEEGNTYYFAELFALVDSNINSLEDMPKKRIAFTSMTGSSGFIFPIGEMIKKGYLRPKTNDFAGLEKALQETFESYTVSGGYEQSLRLLLEGKVDVVGGAHDAPQQYLSTDDQAKIKTVVRLGKSPSHPVVVRKDLDPKYKQLFISSMLLLNNPENVQILKDLYGVDELRPATTENHLADLGERVQAVTGIQEQILDKKN